MRAHADAAFVHLLVNERREGGASLPHTHAQLYALPFVPAAVARERERFTAYATRTMGGNLLADLLQEEVRLRDRIVAIDDEAVLLAPYASRLPFQLMLVPRRARARYEDEGPTGAALLHDALLRLRRRLGASPPLNLWIRTAPQGADTFCWRIDILPRLTHLAGLELGAGMHLCVVAPEVAAQELRRRSDGQPLYWARAARADDEGVDERNRPDVSGWAGLERIALSTAGVLTAAFGIAVLLGGTSTFPVLRDIHQAWPIVSPALALWLLVSGIALVALGSSPETLGSWTRDLRLSAPRQTLVLAARRAGHRARHLRGDRPRRPRARPAPRAPARDRPERHAPRDGRADRPPHRRRLDRAGPAVGAALAVRRARRAAARPARAHLGGARPQRRRRRVRALPRRRGPRPPRALLDRVLGLARQGQPDARGGRAVGRPRRAAGRDPLRRDARHRDPARGRRLAARASPWPSPSAPPAPAPPARS